MNIEFIAPAQEEFKEAVKYYNNQSEGLGFEFALESKRTLNRIIRYPDAWHPLSKRTRRCRTKKFPYGIVYQIKENTIYIIAVMHLHQNPKSWKSRIH